MKPTPWSLLFVAVVLVVGLAVLSSDDRLQAQVPPPEAEPGRGGGTMKVPPPEFGRKKNEDALDGRLLGAIIAGLGLVAAVGVLIGLAVRRKQQENQVDQPL